MNKISAPVKYFSGKTLQNGCEQPNVNKAMRFDSGTIKSASLILKKADNESKYVGKFAMASFNIRKRV